MNNKKIERIIFWGLKISLSFSFLSACADRFGLWGPSGQDGVVWGNFENFVAYTQVLTPWSAGILTTILAWTATFLEITLGILLVTNFKSKEVSLLSGLLILTFGISMIFTVGLKPALDYNVFSAGLAALTIYSIKLKA